MRLSERQKGRARILDAVFARHENVALPFLRDRGISPPFADPPNSNMQPAPPTPPAHHLTVI